MSFSNPVWESTLCGCFGYRTPTGDKLRFCPLFCPLSCCCPCIMLGRIKTMVDKEKPCCCEMGCQGCLCCFMSTICMCPFQMGLSASLRADVARDFRVENGGTCCDICKGCCCVPCSIFQIYVSLEYWLGLADFEDEFRSPAIPPAGTQRSNTATEIVLARLGSTHTFDESDINAANTLPPPSTRSERSESSRAPSRSQQATTPRHTSNQSPPAKAASLRVQIPPGHFAGSKFEVESPNGDAILVVVPPGGKPGMSMDVPL
jgi:hypothetical protein